MTGDAFRFEYAGPTIRFGDGAVEALESELEALDVDNALVVTGETVGSTAAVMDPLTVGVGDRLAGVFAETTPAKRLSTAVDARERYTTLDADGIVAVGGGSSLDVAKVTAMAIAADTDRAALFEEFAGRGTITAPPDRALPPVVVVPTTLAGADQSQVAGITADPEDGPVEEPRSGGVSDPRIMQATAVYDPGLVATTPVSVLRGSAMNGFDKGIETIYAANATPITDATATDGVSTLTEALRALGGDEVDAAVMTPILRGLVLVQYGISRPSGTTLSIIHAFGHGLTKYSDLQQGIAHAVMAPHVLEYLFEHVDARRDRLAAAVGRPEASDSGAAIVDAVQRVRDEMELPSRLRAVDGPAPDQFEAVAEATLADSFMENAPSGLEPTVEELVGVLETAY